MSNIVGNISYQTLNDDFNCESLKADFSKMKILDKNMFRDSSFNQNEFQIIQYLSEV